MNRHAARNFFTKLRIRVATKTFNRTLGTEAVPWTIRYQQSLYI